MISLDELRADVESGAIDTVVVAFTDMQGRLMGKRMQAEFFLEDSPPGVVAARAAGLRCAALTRTFTAERLAEADLLAARIDRELIRRLVSSA